MGPGRERWAAHCCTACGRYAGRWVRSCPFCDEAVHRRPLLRLLRVGVPALATALAGVAAVLAGRAVAGALADAFHRPRGALLLALAVALALVPPRPDEVPGDAVAERTAALHRAAANVLLALLAALCGGVLAVAAAPLAARLAAALAAVLLALLPSVCGLNRAALAAGVCAWAAISVSG